MRKVPDNTYTISSDTVASESPILELTIIESEISTMLYFHTWRVGQT